MPRPRMTDSEYNLWQAIDEMNIDINDLETLAKQNKTIQKQQDNLRITRKINRGLSREQNALEEIGKQLVGAFDKSHLHTPTKAHEHSKGWGGVFHLSDLHLNELIRLMDDVGNEFDFSIASKRLMEFTQKATIVLKAFGVTDILFAMTGDMMNSDRRTDELLSKATDKASAYFISLDLISQVILDLNANGFNIHIASVSGNESRFSLEFSFSEFTMTENWDYMIYRGLERMFKNKDGLNFIQCNPTGDVVEFYGTKFLLDHGMGVRGNNKQKSIQEMNGKQYFKNKPFDFALIGHLHSTQIGDNYARSSSLCGSNVYSDKALNLYGKAAQNIHITKNKVTHSMKIDLQNADCDGYEYDKSLEAYDAKSYKKLHKQETIIKIVV